MDRETFYAILHTIGVICYLAIGSWAIAFQGDASVSVIGWGLIIIGIKEAYLLYLLFYDDSFPF